MGGIGTQAGASLSLYCVLGHVASCFASTTQALAVVLCKDQQHERVDAAV